MLSSMELLLEKAYREKYAIGQFNIHNIEWIRAVLMAAKNQQSPAILGVSAGSIPQMGGFKNIVSNVKNLIEYHEVNVPIVVHLDHGKTVDVCKEAIDAGFSSVMFDGSHLPFNDNYNFSKEIVEYAQLKGVSTELELGTIAGSEDGVVNSDVIYADITECIKLSALNPTALAPALGSTHGLYKGKCKLGFSEMESISHAIQLPLVLHGGTGVSESDIKRSISLGTAKINVNTEFMYLWCQKVKDIFLNSDTDVNDPRKVINTGCNAVTKAIEYKMSLFGSAGRYTDHL